MHLEFYGAAGGVTGSLHRLHVGTHDILLDCGLFQGHRSEANRLNRELPAWATKAHALVLSHAHIDHSGNIPTLVKRGFDGNIFCSPPTRDLCSVMLRDSAMIQTQDANYLNKKARQSGTTKRIEPLYDVVDAQRAVSRMISIPLHRPLEILPGVTVTLHDAGHVLGSCLVQIDVVEQGKKTRLLFTGDLGRDEMPLLRAPEIVEGVDYLLMESTYGDRQHADISATDEQFASIVTETIGRGGRVYIPTFALERAQEILFALDRLHDRKKIPSVPIYIDSPLAIAITEIFKLHPEGLRADVQDRILSRNDPFSPAGLTYVADIQSSRALQESGQPCIVMAGSGMCEGGRILHHFRNGLGDSKNSVVIVGFMAQHTLGRRLVEGQREVKVFGLKRDVWARVHKVNGLSAHADQDGLVEFAKRIAAKGHVKAVALVHGEDDPRATLKSRLIEEGIRHVITPSRGEQLKLVGSASHR